ncbi:Cytosolic copper metallochaperone [Podochytrium sp. JEL0797]|nr:Cytosolic copper metallochaperone [Podochytrium sp. JEL0797]
MTCTGCSGAVNRILSKADGVKSFDINLEEKKVSVVASGLTQDQVLDIIRKSGKTTVPI